MEHENINYDTLRKRLGKVQCPYRLYPARIRALEILTDEQLQREIHRTITSKLPQYFGLIWAKQFESDFEVYGLHDAIHYFHANPHLNEAEPFITDACNLYLKIASLYMTHYRDIEDSDDPRIQSQLALLTFLGAGLPQAASHQMPPLTKPDVIPASMPPPADPLYSRELPVNDVLKFLFPHLGKTKEPSNSAEELIEQFDAKFMFEGFPGLQLVFFEVTKILLSFEIDPFSSTGQYILLTICEHMEEGYYGDFVRDIECIRCGGEIFQTDVSLDNVNMYLAQGGWICEQCQSNLH